MTGALVLLVIIFTAYLIVLAGATAYELTGLDRETARFQALSAFTNCGFTTRASERVVEHAVRRRITMTLILLGYAGVVSVIATLIRSVEVDSWTDLGRNVILLASALLGGWYLLRRRRFQSQLADWLRRMMMRRMASNTVPHEELMIYRKGYGITRIEVPYESLVAGLRLGDLNLQKKRLQVLAIEEHGEVIPIPHAEHLIEPMQHIILYGKLDEVEAVFAPHEAVKQNDPAA